MARLSIASTSRSSHGCRWREAPRCASSASRARASGWLPRSSAHGIAPAEPPSAASILLGWTFPPLPTLGIVVTTVWWLWAVRRVDAAHPANRVPPQRTAAFLLGMLALAFAVDLGHRAVRHVALLGPHGPARPADARRGAADRARGADHPDPAAVVAGDAKALGPSGPALEGRQLPRPPRRRLDHVRGDDVGHPLLGPVQRLARGSARSTTSSTGCS